MNWDDLHEQERHQLRYPNEHAVRFLAGVKKGGAKTVLDIGCGQGRHMQVARDLGFTVTGIDSSFVAATAANEYGETHVGQMVSLPYSDEEFDAVISTGVLYYGTISEMEAAVLEMRRVLRPSGWAFASVKTAFDWRRGSGRQTSEDTFDLVIPGEPEDGMTLTFLAPAGVDRVFGCFRDVRVELAEYTMVNRLRLNSDWLVTAWK